MQNLYPNKKIPRILFWSAVLSGIIVWVLSIVITQLPRNINSFPRDPNVGTLPMFGLQDELFTVNSRGVFFTNFKQQKKRKHVYGTSRFYPSINLYWHQKKLLYLLGFTNNTTDYYIQVNRISDLKIVQKKLLSSQNVNNLKGWYIDTVQQQVVTIHAPPKVSSHYLLVNYRDSLWNIQRRDTLFISPSEDSTSGQHTKENLLNIDRVVKVGAQYYYTAHKSSTHPKGIFMLKKIAHKHYRDTLLLAGGAFGHGYGSIRFSTSDTLLTPKGIKYIPKPPFLPDSNIIKTTPFIYHKNGQAIYYPRYIHQKNATYYIGLPNQRYLKWHKKKKSNRSTLSILDKRGKVLAKNTVTIPVTKYSLFNCLILANDIIYFEAGSRLRHARFDSRTLQRVGPPKFWPDFLNKIDYSLTKPITKTSFFALVSLALLGLPFICLLGFRSTRSISRQRQLLFVRLYLIISVLAIILERNFILDYL